MTGSSPRLTTLQLTHQGEGAGSTQSIFSLSRELALRGHRVLVGCPPGTLLARMVADSGSLLEHIAFDFRRIGPLSNALARVIEERHVDVVNSHATRDRRALTLLRWRRRLPQPLVVTRRTMPLTSPPELVSPDETGLLVSPLDAGAWARALDRLLTDTALRDRVARAGRVLARREFTMERTAERTELVYQEAIARRQLLVGKRAR